MISESFGRNIAFCQKSERDNYLFWIISNFVDELLLSVLMTSPVLKRS